MSNIDDQLKERENSEEGKSAMKIIQDFSDWFAEFIADIIGPKNDPGETEK